MEFLTGKQTFHSLGPCNLDTATKQDIKQYFENSFDLNETIFTGLADASAIYKCPDRLRLPLIFYYGHTAAVYINKLVLSQLLQPSERVRFEFEALFETGVDEMTWDDTENYRLGGEFKWPTVNEVVEYRKRVRELILTVIDRTPLTVPITMDSPWWAIFMGMEHERIHLETSTVLIRQLPINLVKRPEGWVYAPINKDSGDYFKNPMITVPHSQVTLGKPRDHPSYGWDNEYGELPCMVPSFECNQYLVTNQEFYEFVLDEGYSNRRFWTEEGWNWVQYRQAKHPTFWVCKEGCKSGCGGVLANYSHCHHKRPEQFVYRAIYDEIAMPWDWPVDVNYHEAKAFCKWRGAQYRLPCEAEYQAMRSSTSENANINLQFGSSSPVGMHGTNRLGFCDVTGNVWQWTEDHFNGLPGFKTHYLYDDFSTPTFDGRHNMILGGSWISTGDEASRFARYAFRRHFFQHCGFRVARSVDAPARVPVRFITEPVYVKGAGYIRNPLTIDSLEYVSTETTNTQYNYESEEMLNEYLKFEYGTNSSFPQQLAEVTTSAVTDFGGSLGRLLHLGSSSGLCSLLLTKTFAEVLSVDYCGRFIDICEELVTTGRIHYTSFDGFKRSRQEVTLPGGVDCSRIAFKQLTWLPNEVKTFDCILAGFLDRVQNVQAWTARFVEILRPNGLLIVASQTWTPQNLNLNPKLVLLQTLDIPYSHGGYLGNATFSVWRLRDEGLTDWNRNVDLD